MKCPNKNSKEYKIMSSILGGHVAHFIWNANNGNPVWLNSDGTESNNFKKLEKAYGFNEAIRLRSTMLTPDFIKSHGSDFVNGSEVLIDDNMFFSGKKIVPNKNIDSISLAVSKYMENLKSSRTMDMLIKNMETIFPGFSVIRETSQTAISKGKKANTSWVDKEGYHINLESLTYQTPVHELSHVFLHLIESNNPEAWQNILSQVESKIEDNDIYNRLREDNPSMDEDLLKKEYLAMIAGSVSESTIKDYVESLSINVNENGLKGLYLSSKNLMKEIWNTISDILGIYKSKSLKNIDLSKATLEDIFDALATDLINGNSVQYLSYEDRQMLFDKYNSIGSEEFHSMDTEPVTRIETIADIPNILMNNEDRSVMSAGYGIVNDPNIFADMVYSHVYKIDGRKETFLDWMGKKFTFHTTDEKTIKGLIKTEVLEYHVDTITRFPDNMKKVIENYSSAKGTLSEVITEAFKTKDGSIRIRMNEIQRLVDLMGGNDRVKKIIRLSELSQEYPKFSGVIDSSLIGFDPYVIVHDDSNGLDISISDITVGDTGIDDSNNSDNNKLLTSRFRADYNSLITGEKITWTNSKKDTRAAALVVAIAGINHLAHKNNIKLKVRRAGVYGMRGGLRGMLSTRSIYDFNNAFKQVRYTMRLEGMKTLTKAGSLIEEIVKDDLAWETKNMQVPHSHELLSYYMTEGIDQKISDKFREGLMGKNLSREEHIDVIRKRMRLIEMNSTNNEFLNNIEYQVLSKAIIGLKKGWHVNNMNFRDVDKMLMHIINPHNVGNSLIQYAANQFEISKSIVVNKANVFNNELMPLIDAVKKQKHLITGDARKIFEGMFPEVEVIADKDYEKTDNHEAVKKGQKIKVKLYNQIYSHSYNGVIPNTVSEQELKLGDFILKTVRTMYVKEKYNDMKRNSSDYTIENAEEWFDNTYTKGTIPVLPANTTQLFKSGNYKKWMEMFLNNVAQGDIQYADMASANFHDLSTRFTKQVMEKEQLEDMGLVKKGNDYVATNLDALFQQSYNLEYTIKLFQLEMERSVEFTNNVVPVYNELIAVANHVRSATGNEMINTREYLRQYSNLIIYRKREDDIQSGGITKKVAPLIRTTLQLNSFLNIGYRPIIWVKSAYFNIQNQYIGAIASSIANIGIKNGNVVHLPNVSELTKAHELTFTEFKKVWALAKKMQLVNGTEKDVMDNIINNITDNHMFKQQFAHWGNWATDVATRCISAVSFMIHDGSYDAHIYDEKTGELSYDVKKDKRFYNGDKPIEGWDAVHKAIIENQRSQGLLENDKQVIGYDFDEINGRFKWYADKFLIGSMDNYQKTLLGNIYMGAAVGQFRSFSWDKLWNIYGGTIEGGFNTDYNSRLIPVKDENGEWITVKEQQHMEGMLRSVVECARSIKDILNEPKQTWENMPPLRRRNVAELFLRGTILGMFAFIFSQFAGSDDDDEDKWGTMSKRDKKKLEFMFSDLLAIDSVDNLFSNIVPSFRLLGDAYDMIFGEHRVQKMVRYVGPLNDALWIYELSSSNDQVFKNKKSEKEDNKEDKDIPAPPLPELDGNDWEELPK